MVDDRGPHVDIAGEEVPPHDAGSRLTGRPPAPERPSFPTPAPRKKVALTGDLLVAVGVIGMGVFFAVGAFQIRVIPSYAHIGPRFFPLLVAAGMLVAGGMLLVQALQGDATRPAGGEDVDPTAPTDWRAVAIVSAALVFQAVFMQRLGFVLSSAALFWGIAFGFGSRRYLRDALAGLALAAVAYLSFTRLLDLHLPAGAWWETLAGVLGKGGA